MRHHSRGFSRTERIADQIQRDLALLLQREIKDPRVRLPTISGVKVSKDLSYADVYITFMAIGDSDKVKEALTVLDNASGLLRSLLSKSIKLRVMPRLRFHYDQTIVEGPRISALINAAVAEDKARGRDDPDRDGGGRDGNDNSGTSGPGGE
ncbi:MAG TPA: 30S ribosome-binding factor RbfA [Dongiaceae bacterium]|nr:30S ribosome-binding factor RbfA [Dongiaceae bacterium]